MNSGDVTIDAMRQAARAISSPTTAAPDTLRLVRTAINSLTAFESACLAEMAECGIPEAEGASSVSTWARRELHQDAGKTRAQVRAAHALRDLPRVAEAAKVGRISERHVEAFAYALKHIGFDKVRELEDPLLEFALHLSPEDLFARLREMKAIFHPEDLDKAWERGMDKADIKLAKLIDGWHLTGFLPTEVGEKFKTILDSLSVPRDEGDDRAPSTRRVDALDELLTSVLENGLPSDNGIRPHLHVVVRDDKPVDLEGFGPIGPALAGLIGCTAAMTPYLVNEAGDVTGIGRSKRYATPSQAKLIRMRQGGRCASPGCNHPISHNHHIRFYSEGGVTELDNLIGLCRKCHTLVHLGRLTITGGTHPTVLPHPRARTG